MERLQKFLARCGVASRRKCEELITAGNVWVDGEQVTTLGTKVDADAQIIEVNGQRVHAAPLLYFALHKPRGVVCTHHDPAGRPRAVDLIPVQHLRMFPIGRLDEDSEGLLLLTNDGELTQRIAHPRYQVPKVYRVLVNGKADPEALQKIRQGVWLSEGKTSPAKVDVLRQTHASTTLRITLKEGKNRHLRRVLAKVELPVKRLIRVQVGPVRIGTLKKGEFRRLSKIEVEALRDGETVLPKKGGRGTNRKGAKGKPGKKAAGRAGGTKKPSGSKKPGSTKKAGGTKKTGGARQTASAKKSKKPASRQTSGPKQRTDKKPTSSKKTSTRKNSGGRGSNARSTGKGSGSRPSGRAGGGKPRSGAKRGRAKGA